MEFRRAKSTELNEIMKIIKMAQEALKKNGVDQWQDNYPNEQVIKEDIERGESYLLIDNNKVIGTTVLSFETEETYNEIFDGQWITNSKYGVIHRIAVDNEVKGKNAAREIIYNAQILCKNKNINSIKVDTHEDNIVMRKFLEKNNFKYCGIIYLIDKSKRLAFEKILK